MNTSNMWAKHGRSTVGKITRAFVCTVVLSGMLLTPALGQENQRRQGGQARQENQRRQGDQARQENQRRYGHQVHEENQRHHGQERAWRAERARREQAWQERAWRARHQQRVSPPYRYPAPIYTPPPVVSPPPYRVSRTGQ